MATWYQVLMGSPNEVREHFQNQKGKGEKEQKNPTKKKRKKKKEEKDHLQYLFIFSAKVVDYKGMIEEPTKRCRHVLPCLHLSRSTWISRWYNVIPTCSVLIFQISHSI